MVFRPVAFAFLACLLPIAAAATAPARQAPSVSGARAPIVVAAPPPASRPLPVPSPDIAAPEPDPPGLRRCVNDQGQSVFTDRRCESLGAEPAPPPSANASPAAVVRARSCARNQGDLLEGVRGALETRDPNRLAEFYHWSGLSTAEGYRLMDRLANLSARPLMDVQLVSSAQRSEPPSDWPGRRSAFAGVPGRDLPPGVWRDFDEPERRVDPPAPRQADLLRVDQMRAQDDYDAEVTWFHLRSNAGCWWLQF